MSKTKYTLEYNLKSIPVMLLWNYLSTPSGLSQWFADKVVQHGKSFIFTWNKSDSRAYQVGVRHGGYIRMRWEEDDEEKYFFEIKISVSELTDATMLIITDFACDDEIDESKKLWNHQVDSLKRILGC